MESSKHNRIAHHASAADQERSTHWTSSLFNKSTKSPGRGFCPQNAPPIETRGSNTPLTVSAHTSAKRKPHGNRGKWYTDLKTEEESSNIETGQEEALQALASYAAFQLTLLRYIEEDATFAYFTDQR